MLTNPIVTDIAAARGVSPAAVLLRFNLQRGVAVIPKSVSPSRIDSNLNEPWRFELSREDIGRLRTLPFGRFCTAPWSTFDDRSASEKLISAALTAVGSVIFSVVSLDVTA